MKSAIQYFLIVCIAIMGMQMQGFGRAQSSAQRDASSLLQALTAQQTSRDVLIAQVHRGQSQFSPLVEPSAPELFLMLEEVEDDKWHEVIAHLKQNKSHQFALLLSLLARNLDDLHQRIPSDHIVDLMASHKSRCLTFCLLRI